MGKNTANSRDDLWKEQLLDRPFLTNVDYQNLTPMEKEWVDKYPHVFSKSQTPNIIYNLLHYDNRNMVKILKKCPKK